MDTGSSNPWNTLDLTGFAKGTQNSSYVYQYCSAVKTGINKKMKTPTCSQQKQLSPHRENQAPGFVSRRVNSSPVHSLNFVFWNASVLSTRWTSFYYLQLLCDFLTTLLSVSEGKNFRNLSFFRHMHFYCPKQEKIINK